jgi:hypothetical protein
MSKTMLRDQKTIKVIADNFRVSSDQACLPPNVVIMPMAILEKPERIPKKRKTKK